MIWAEFKKYLSTSFFLILNVINVGVLGVYSLFLAGADRVGLAPTTGLDYMMGAANLYTTALLPLSLCLFAAYGLASEYQWRTLMLPIVAGVSRWDIVRAKVALCVMAIFIFSLVFLITLMSLAYGLFSLEEAWLENRLIPPWEAISRVALGMGVLGLVIFLFGLLAMVLVIWSRQLVLAALGSFLAFFMLVLTQNPHSPLDPLFQVARMAVQAADLITPAFVGLLLRGLGAWLVIAGVLFGVLGVSFAHRDVVLE